METSNKRKFDRVTFRIAITLTIDGNTVHYTKTHDISMNGIFVVTDETLPLDTEGDFEIVLAPGREGIAIKGSFKVVNIFEKRGEKGMGLHFMKVDPDASVELYRVVKYNREMQEA